MSKRVPIIAGNWKTHKTPSEAKALVTELLDGLKPQWPACEVLVAPPFVSIPAVVQVAGGSPMLISGQDVYWEDTGAFTGQVSAPMLKDAGCSHVIIGHSERRQYFGETDQTVNMKIKSSLRAGLVPIFCLGETLEQREAGKTFDVVKTQLIGGMEGVEPLDPNGFVIAYEPVWAIGTGKTATPEQAQEVHGFLRDQVSALRGLDFAAKVRILYGGSVKPSNTKTLMDRQDIDGALVGGASLKADDFLGIVREAI